MITKRCIDDWKRRSGTIRQIINQIENVCLSTFCLLSRKQTKYHSTRMKSPKSVSFKLGQWKYFITYWLRYFIIILQTCVHDLLRCVQIYKDVHFSRRRIGSHLWHPFTKENVPIACDCMWPIEKYGPQHRDELWSVQLNRRRHIPIDTSN